MYNNEKMRRCQGRIDEEKILIRLKKLQCDKRNRDGQSYEPGYIYVIRRNDNRKSDGNYFREHG